VPGSHSSSGAEPRQRSGSLTGRRRAAIDISPAAVQRLATKVAVMETANLRASLDEANCGIMHTEVELLYTDMQLIHRGRCGPCDLHDLALTCRHARVQACMHVCRNC